MSSLVNAYLCDERQSRGELEAIVKLLSFLVFSYFGLWHFKNKMSSLRALRSECTSQCAPALCSVYY